MRPTCKEEASVVRSWKLYPILRPVLGRWDKLYARRAQRRGLNAAAHKEVQGE